MINDKNVNELNKKLNELQIHFQQLLHENAELKKNANLDDVISLKQIIAHMPGNVFWKDINGHYLGCNNNHLKLFGYQKLEDIIGKHNQNIIPAPVADMLDAVDKDIIASKKGRYLEEKGFDENGQPAIYYTQKIPLLNQQKEVIGLLGISLNITEQKQLEEDLKIAKEKAEAASRAKSEFMANMSHDIKTPLAGIIGISELLKFRLKGEDAEFANTLLQSSQQLMNFFDNCLEVFKLENANPEHTKEHFDIREVLKQIETLFCPMLKAKQLEFEIQLTPDIPIRFYGFRSAFYRIILNLVANAIKFTDEGKVIINITATHFDQNHCQLKISVKDTGIGIPKDKQKIIFERFTRLVPSYKGTYEGTGIGLYIVKMFTDAMNGIIDVNSESGKGSEFLVEIPLEISNKKDINSVSVVTAISNTCHKKRRPIKILLVEDNIITQRVQRSILNSMNYQTDVASTGEQALEMFTPGKYDLVFLDIGLPGIPGDAVSKRIREIEKETGYHVPIIALTAHINDDIDYYCRAALIEGVYSKPLSRQQAKYVVEEYCH